MKTKKMHSVIADDEGRKHIANIKELLTLIGTEMQKYEAQDHFDWSNCGDLGHIEEQLGEVWDFIAGTD